MFDLDPLLSPQVEYKRGHDERVSRFTTVADTPELLRARAGGQLQNDVRNDDSGESVILIYDSPFFPYLEKEGRGNVGGMSVLHREQGNFLRSSMVGPDKSAHIDLVKTHV